MKSKPLSLELLKLKCVIDLKTECWNFIGDKSQRYPRINFDGRCIKASHAAIILKLGREVKSGMCVLHSCDNTRCANPDHVREGTHQDNKADAISRGRCSGWKLSNYTRVRQSIARLGMKLSDETRKKLSESRREYYRRRREESKTSCN